MGNVNKCALDTFFLSGSLVTRFTHIMYGEVGNPGFEPQPLHIISL